MSFAQGLALTPAGMPAAAAGAEIRMIQTQLQATACQSGAQCGEWRKPAGQQAVATGSVMKRISGTVGWVLSAALLWGCASLAGAQKLPPWATEPPADSAEAWYAVGEGASLDEARRTALRTVAAKLRSAVSGQVSSAVIDNNGNVSRSARIEVNEEVLKTEFSRVDIVSSAPGPVGVVALIKVDRPTFLADTRTQLGVLAQPIAEVEAALPSQSSLEQFIALRRVAPQLEQAAVLSLLLSGAGAQAEGRAGTTRFGGLRQRSDQLSSRLSFELRAPPADADIASAIGGFLADHGMRSATTRSAGANVLSIHSSQRDDDLFGTKLTKLKVRVSVADDKGRAVASREYDVSGSSRYDFKGAREAAVARLAADMKKAGPMAGLGFKE